LRARDGAGGVVLIEGEPGLGKTRLLDELVHRVRLERAAVAAARAVPSDAGDMWSGLTGLLAGGLDGAPGMAAAPPEALATLGTRGAGPAGGRWNPARVVTAIAQAVADEQPVLLALDDAQHLDPASSDALPRVARDLDRRPVLIVVCLETGIRLPWADGLRARIGRDLAGDVIGLEQLDAPALTTLARWWLPHYGESDLTRLVRRLERDSAGVPLLATAMLEAVANGFRLSPNAPAWPGEQRTLVDTLPGALPPAAIGAVCARFQQLAPPEQEVLGAGAALAERLTAATLEKATGRDRRAVEQALDRLEWDRWLTADARGYAFAAPIVRAILRQEMLTPGQLRRYATAAGG
jgi:AAA ATPase domain